MKPTPIAPQPGQESVWDYPRPPRLEPTRKRIQVIFAGTVIADSVRAWRVLETSHPPVYYIPPEDIRMDLLQVSPQSSYCEWKGGALYFDLEVNGHRVQDVAWAYPQPVPAFAPIRDFLAFYAGRVEACYVDGERVTPQPGNFYGGWITSDIVGPFKGEPSTWGW
ncbi:MAG: DUF427 domain-containing protein [Blastocatellia bacterium]|nr:DUF427 domain-containing protein [Blastocatellia bacterium]